MTPAQTAELLAFCAAFDRRTVGKADVLAWQTVLADIDFNAAKSAVTAHYAEETRWIMPADIRGAVREIRHAQASDFQGPGLPAAVPDADPDDVPAYLAALRAQRVKAADGLELKPRPIAQLLAGVGRSVPTEAPKSGPSSVECPHCGAAPMRRCRNGQNKPLVAFHPSRIEAGKAAS